MNKTQSHSGRPGWLFLLHLIMLILGVSAYFHDAAAAIVLDGKVLAAAQEERFTRIKNDASFPIQAIRYCMEFAGATLDELDAVVFYDKPLLKLERLLESYHTGAPAGLRSWLTAMPVWIRQKMMLRKVIRDELYRWQPFDKKRLPLLFCEHHLSHAASAFYVSPYEEAAILTIDGVGEWATTVVGKGKGKEIGLIKEVRFPHSLGLLYSAATYYCGFKVNSGEYKLMGLAPYGDEQSPQFLAFKEKITSHLVTIYEDGSFFLHQEYFQYLTGLRMTNDKKWMALFGFPRREPESSLEQQHCNLALAFQKVTEEIVLRLAKTAKQLTGMDNLCLAGGVALNCVANGKILDMGLFKNVFIQPAGGDAGGALGAALAGYHIYFGKDRLVDPSRDGMSHAYLGPAYTASDIRKMCATNGAIYTEYAEEELIDVVAEAIGEGKIIGWFQDRMEFGARALGNRSILADPRNADMQKRLNLSIKYRESFRPFAPVCRIERAADYTQRGGESPYMLLTDRLKGNLYHALPEGYNRLEMMDKLAVARSRFPAITHVDLSSRWQTVTREANPRLWQLLKVFEALTGDGVLINTSLNVRGEPIVCSPGEAYDCLMGTEMDLLVLNNIIIFKRDQASGSSARVAGAKDQD
jgi:carbamoyltransferase